MNNNLEEKTDDVDVACLHPQYNGCIIGHTVSTIHADRVIYSLNSLVSREMILTKCSDAEARKTIAGLVRESENLHGDKAPIFVEERPADMKALAEMFQGPKADPATPAEIEEGLKILAEPESKIAKPFPGTLMPDYLGKTNAKNRRN